MLSLQDFCPSSPRKNLQIVVLDEVLELVVQLSLVVAVDDAVVVAAVVGDLVVVDLKKFQHL